MSKRAVLYARVSGDDRGNEGRNLESQIADGRRYALGKGYQVIEEITEDEKGASGASESLEGLRRIKELARVRAFDVLVAREMDRLSRSRPKLWRLEDELSEAGVAIEFALDNYADTPEGRLMKGIRAEIAQYERGKIAERMVRGRNNKIKSGQVVAVGRVAYGYRNGVVDAKGALRMLGPDQKPQLSERTTIVPYQPEAETVRLIYVWYVKGDEAGTPLSLRAIVRKLEGVPTFADVNGLGRKSEWGRWSATCVRNILKNETYCGLWHFGPRKVHTKVRDNPPEDALSVEVPAIVDRQLWEAAQKRLIWNREHSRRNRKHPYLLAGMIRCGACLSGATGCMVRDYSGGTVRLYYRCNAKWSNTTHGCDSRSFRADEVDAAVWKWVSLVLQDSEALKRGLKNYQAEQETLTEPLRAELRRDDARLAKHRDELERLLEHYVSDNWPAEMVTKHKLDLESKIRELEIDRARLAAELTAATLTPEQIEGLQEFADRVRDDLARAATDFETRRGLLERLRLQVTLSVEDGKRIARASFLVWSEDLEVVCNTGNSGSPTRERC